MANSKGKFVVGFKNLVYHSRRLGPIFVVLKVLYRAIVNWILCIDIPWSLEIGNNLMIYHGFGLVVHSNVRLGSDVTLRHSTTIGEAVKGGPVPVVGNNVNIGAHVVILGELVIGDNVRIGSGTVVLKSVPNNSTVVGNPMRIIRNN